MRPRFTPQHLLALGLLLLSGSLVLRHLLPITDWATGFLLGIGLGFELLALHWAIRLRTPRY